MGHVTWDLGLGSSNKIISQVRHQQSKHEHTHTDMDNPTDAIASNDKMFNNTFVAMPVPLRMAPVLSSPGAPAQPT